MSSTPKKLSSKQVQYLLDAIDEQFENAMKKADDTESPDLASKYAMKAHGILVAWSLVRKVAEVVD